MELAPISESDNLPLVDRGHKNVNSLTSSLEITHGRSKRDEHATRYEEDSESKYNIQWGPTKFIDNYIYEFCM